MGKPEHGHVTTRSISQAPGSTPTPPDASNLCNQDTLFWRKWTNGGCCFPFCLAVLIELAWAAGPRPGAARRRAWRRCRRGGGGPTGSSAAPRQGVRLGVSAPAGGCQHHNGAASLSDPSLSDRDRSPTVRLTRRHGARHWQAAESDRDRRGRGGPWAMTDSSAKAVGRDCDSVTTRPLHVIARQLQSQGEGYRRDP